MSKSPFWGTVTHVLVPVYILQALNMRTCLNQLTMSSMTYFISQANAGIRFSRVSRNWKVWRGFGKNEGEWTGEAEIRTRKKLWHWLSILGYILTYSVLLRENIRQLWVFNIGTLIFLRPQCPVTRTHLRQRETESCNILNCSNNKIICGNGLFCHNK